MNNVLAFRDYHDGDILVRYRGMRQVISAKNTIKDIGSVAASLGLTYNGLKIALIEFRQKGISKFYVEPSLERPEETAWESLAARYPGINKDYLFSLLSAGHRYNGETPIIVCTGPTSAGKSATVHLAAKLLGTGVYEHAWNNKPNTVIAAAKEAAKKCCDYLLYDEFTKFVPRFDGSILDAALLLTRSSISRCPVVVFTDVRLPEYLLRIRQITRRTRFFKLDRQVSWPPVETVVKNCPESVSIIGHAIRRQWKVQKFDNSVFLKLLDEITLATKLPPQYANRCVGEGWKLIDLSRHSELSELWKSVSDISIGGSARSSMQLAEVNLSQILGTPIPLVLEYREDRLNQDIIYVRIVAKVDGRLVFDRYDFTENYNGFPNNDESEIRNATYPTHSFNGK